MSERDLMGHVRALLRDLGWQAVYHTHRSDRSDAGFPDLIALRGPRQVCIELKSSKGRPTTAQLIWLEAFARIPGSQAFLWRPEDLLSGEIARSLR